MTPFLNKNQNLDLCSLRAVLPGMETCGTRANHVNLIFKNWDYSSTSHLRPSKIWDPKWLCVGYVALRRPSSEQFGDTWLCFQLFCPTRNAGSVPIKKTGLFPPGLLPNSLQKAIKVPISIIRESFPDSSVVISGAFFGGRGHLHSGMVLYPCKENRPQGCRNESLGVESLNKSDRGKTALDQRDMDSPWG